MSNKFNEYDDTSSLSTLLNGTADIYVNSCMVSDLLPNMPVKTDGNKTLYSTKIQVGDIQGDILSNPYTGNLVIDGEVYCDNVISNGGYTMNNEFQKIRNMNASSTGASSFSGSLTAGSFIKQGGLSTEFLMADGSTSTSSGGLSSNIYLYRNSTATSGIPASPYIRFNNTTQQNATQIYVSFMTSDNLDVDAFLSLINGSSILYIQERNNSNNYIKYNVSAVSQVPNSYTMLSVSFNSGEGRGLTSFLNDTLIFCSVFIDGVEIDTRISTVENDIITLQNKTQYQTTDATHTIFSSRLTAPELDNPGGTLMIAQAADIMLVQADTEYAGNLTCEGKILTNSIQPIATTMNICTTGSGSILNLSAAGTVNINSSTCNVLNRLNCSNIEVITGNMNIGTIANGNIAMGKSGGIVSVNSDLAVANVDLANSLNIGTALCTGLNISRVGINTNIFGNVFLSSLNSSSALSIGGGVSTSSLTIGKVSANAIFPGSILCSNLDVASGSMNLCASLGNATIGKVGGVITMPGTLACPSVDLAATVSVGSALATQIFIGRNGITSTILGTAAIPTIDTATGVAIGTNAITPLISIGRLGLTTVNNGSLTVATQLNTPIIDNSAGVLTIGGNTTSMNISKLATTLNVLGTLSVATSTISPLVKTPSVDTNTAVAMTIGTATQTGLTIGRATVANTTINGLATIFNNTPYIISTAATSPRITICRWCMTNILATQVANQALTSTGYGLVAFTAAANDVNNNLIVGTSLRYKFNGYLQSMAAASTLAFVLTHGASLTQNFFSITFANATTAGYINGEFHLMVAATGTTTSPIIDGFVNYIDGTTPKYIPIQISTWTSPLNTTISNAFSVSCNITGTVQYVINHFTIEQLR